MKTKILTILCILLLTVVSVQAAPFSPEACDSLCRTPLLLHFRFDRSLVEYDYMDNPRTLEEFDRLFSDSVSVSRIDTLVIASYSSPDGNSYYNQRLAYRRAVAVKGYLIWKYPGLDQYRILIRPQGEDWAGLRRLVEADNAVPGREDVLSILDKMTDADRRKALLRQLNRGNAYQYIYKRLLPKLRNAAVCTVYLKKTEPVKQETACADSSNTSLKDSLSAEKERALYSKEEQMDEENTSATNANVTSVPADIPVAARRPIIALKTNLLTWAGLTPEGKLAAFRPNLAAEVFFARCWSVEASAAYSHWKGGKGNQFWGLSGYSLEPRFWLNGDGTYRWLYLGAYGQLGDFDHRPYPADDRKIEGVSTTGSYWSSGLSLGIYLPLTRHLGLEAGLRGGYRHADCKAYDYEPAHDYYHHDFTSNRWGITGFNFSVTYRWLTK